MQGYSVKIRKQQNKLYGDIKSFLPQNNALDAEYDFPIWFELVGNCNSSLSNERGKFIEKIYVDPKKGSERNYAIDFMNDFLPMFCQEMSNKFRKEYIHLLYFIPTAQIEIPLSTIFEDVFLKDLSDFYLYEKMKINESISEKERLCLCWPPDSKIIFPCFLGETVSPGEMIIMGVLLNQGISNDDYLAAARKQLLQKSTLDEFLRNNHVSAFWFCETDFNAVSFWNKNIPQDILNSIYDEFTRISSIETNCTSVPRKNPSDLKKE
jgi:hypothetical protein